MRIVWNTYIRHVGKWKFLDVPSEDVWYEGWYKSNASYSFSESIIKIVIKFAYIMGTAFTKLRLFFNKVSFFIDTFYSTFEWDAICGSSKTLCWSFGSLHGCCVSAHRCLQNDVLRLCPSGGQKDGSWRVLNWECRDDEGELSTPLLVACIVCRLVCGLALSCTRWTCFIFLFGWTFWICFNFFNVCAHHWELTEALLSRVPLTRFLHCSTRC
jgi:hypothetical protein